MQKKELKVARIGNSRGVRIPAETLQRFGIGDHVIMEEREEGILLRPVEGKARRMSWEETARAMAAASEDWSDLDGSLADGLETAPWETKSAKRVAEAKRKFAPKRTRVRKPK